MSATNRALWVGSNRCAISCKTIYSRHSKGFFARSVFSRIFREEVAQLPHFVFIRWTSTRFTFTFKIGSHFAIIEPTFALIWRR